MSESKRPSIVWLGGTVLALALATGCGDRALGQAQDGGMTPDALGGRDSVSPRHDVVVPGAVTVFTDKLRYALGDSPKATVHNGTNEVIYLGGCGIFDMHELLDGQWVDHGSAMDCYWEGNARPLAPGQDDQQGVFFYQPGRWRVALRYGVGCDPKAPLDSCARLSTVYSAEVQVEATAKDCENVATHYANAVQNAQRCQPSGGKMPCTVAVPQWLSNCGGCDVPINVDDQAMVTSWAERWKSYRCDELMPPQPCPGMACEAPLPADCVNGRCQTR